MKDDLMVFLKPLFLTLLFECTAAYLYGIKKKKDLFLIVLVNIVTNPLLVLFSLFLMYHLSIGKAYLITYLILEPIVVYAEYRFFSSFLESEKDPFRLSVLLNVVSVLGGIVCQLL